MNLERHVEAKLDGVSPSFPLGTDFLNTTFHEYGGMSGGDLDQIGIQIDGYIGQFHQPTTSDGYVWFWAMIFQVGSPKDKVVIVVFPWARKNKDEYGDNILDRSISFYYDGPVVSGELSSLLVKLINAIKVQRSKG